MSEQLYRQVVKTDGDEGHWFAYEPAIELIRCHECVFFEKVVHRFGFCYRDPGHTGMLAPAYKDGFCAWGERRGS